MKKVIQQNDNIQSQLYKEWLVTNALGGFASGTIGGVPQRKHHSLLNAALPSPHGRANMLNFVDDKIITKKTVLSMSPISTEKHKEPSQFSLKSFKLENGLPFWVYEKEGIIIEKALFLIHLQNTLCLSYKVLAAPESIQLSWRPYFHFRTSRESVDLVVPNESYVVMQGENFQYEITHPDFPILRITSDRSPLFVSSHEEIKDVYYKIEDERGYPSVGKLTSPCFFSQTLNENERVSFLVSTEPWPTIQALEPKEAWLMESLRRANLLKTSGQAINFPMTSKLVLAADQFIITPRTRLHEVIRLQAAGEEVKSIIAGYPWFTDWGRDTMIALEGLTLSTGRAHDAYAILQTFAHHVKLGLIPNTFPDGQGQGVYNTADASLWFFHALDRYVEYTKDREIIEFLLPVLQEILHYHIKGTLFGIKADGDGLLKQGQEGFQLTWMDAKVGDWVVTPRRGKAVEINALWYNALKLYEQWTGTILEITPVCYKSFNQKFWYEEGQYLYDLIDDENKKDPSIRPNQLFAISLRNPVLNPDKWKSVLEKVQQELLTPFGLRTLNASHPDYKALYEGDLLARDAAYHQGTVWPWLLGPFIDVWLKVYPDDFEGAYQLLRKLEDHLDDYCVGSIGEIFDASPPHKERGCFAQAWSVAELLRCLIKILPMLSKK